MTALGHFSTHSRVGVIEKYQCCSRYNNLRAQVKQDVSAEVKNLLAKPTVVSLIVNWDLRHAKPFPENVTRGFECPKTCLLLLQN